MTTWTIPTARKMALADNDGIVIRLWLLIPWYVGKQPTISAPWRTPICHEARFALNIREGWYQIAKLYIEVIVFEILSSEFTECIQSFWSCWSPMFWSWNKGASCEVYTVLYVKYNVLLFKWGENSNCKFEDFSCLYNLHVVMMHLSWRLCWFYRIGNQIL